MNHAAVEFIRDFIRKEHEAVVAIATERDEDAYQAKIQAVQDCFGPGISTGDVGLVRLKVNDEWFTKGEARIKRQAPRKLFLIRAYEHATHGKVYANYVSNNGVGDEDYEGNFFVAEQDGKLKLIARYLINDSHTKWEWFGGAKLKQLGKIQDTERFDPPANPKDLADYEADKTIIALP